MKHRFSCRNRLTVPIFSLYDAWVGAPKMPQKCRKPAVSAGFHPDNGPFCASL